MKRLIAGMAAVAMLTSPGSAESGEHLVSSATVQTRLAEASEERDRNLRFVRSVLSEPTVRSIAASIHLNPDSIVAGLPVLTDRELSDLADRAQRLTTDPNSGMSPWVKGTLIVLGIVVAILVILAIHLQQSIST